MVCYFLIVADALQLIIDVKPFVDACCVFIDGYLSTHTIWKMV